MLAYLFLSPDAPKTNEANQAKVALDQLNNQVVIAETIIRDTKAKLDAQTYDATADFQKSREISEVTPPLTQQEVEKIMKRGKEVVEMLGGLKGEALLEKMKAEEITLEDLKDLYDKLGDCYVWYGAWKSRAEEDKYRAERGSRGVSKDVAKREINYSTNKETEAGDLMDKTFLIIKEYNNAQLEAAKAGGVVTDYTKIAENPKLAEVIDKLHITFKKDEKRGKVKVYVNGEYTNFDALYPKYDESYEIFPDAQNIGVIFVVKSKDGSVFRKKFTLNENEIQEFSRRNNQNEWELMETYPIP